MLFVSLVFNSGRSVRAIGFLTITEIYLFFPSCLDPDQARERRKPILPWLTFRPGQNSRTESRKDVPYLWSAYLCYIEKRELLVLSFIMMYSLHEWQSSSSLCVNALVQCIWFFFQFSICNKTSYLNVIIKYKVQNQHRYFTFISISTFVNYALSALNYGVKRSRIYFILWELWN